LSELLIGAFFIFQTDPLAKIDQHLRADKTWLRPDKQFWLLPFYFCLDYDATRSAKHISATSRAGEDVGMPRWW
jgi:hypothetical protein